MPIFIRNFDWKQSAKKLHITIPLKNVQSSKLHLFTSAKYVKLTFPPYIFELVLEGSIQTSKSKCMIKSEEVVLELVKEFPICWNQLQENVGNKELINVKNKAMETVREIAAKESATKAKQKSEQISFLREHQMMVNREEKQMIQSLKNEQKAYAMRELVGWKSSQKNHNQERTKKSKAGNDKNLPVPVPLPRNASIISFSFTPRLLPTPQRESKTKEEEEWLKRQAEIIRSSGFNVADLSDEERNPLWLLNKGISFFQNTNYLGALNAFEYATKISPKMAILYVKLADTLLKLKWFPKAIIQASIALELLMPIVPQNRDLRIEALKIRAEAYQSIGEQKLCEADLKKVESMK